MAGASYEFWHRTERVNRVVLKGLQPDTVYEFQVRKGGRAFRFRTLPASLDDRPVKIVFTGDHQQPSWTANAHDNARMAAAQKPDMFVVAGDFVNDEGNPTSGNAARWVTYLNNLFGVGTGHFFYDIVIGGQTYRNLVIPHLAVIGNHEIGEEHHLRWPSCVSTTQSSPGYPRFTAANWTELLFHWPYKSEGFRCEIHSNHPNITNAKEGFGHGGFGKLGFGDYLMLVAMDNCCQNWAAEPDKGLRDWQGNLITGKWPWFETQHADVRQDLWLKEVFEPAGRPSAGESFKHIIPVYHRGLFGTSRANMTLKNRDILEHWLPVFDRNNVRFIQEAHDHLYSRTIPMGVSQQQPPGTHMDTITYSPLSWPLTPNLPQSYIDEYYTIKVVRDNTTKEIVGWEHKGNYITHNPKGFIVQGHGGWAGSRRTPGSTGGGNAGNWFVDPEKGGESFGGNGSFHITTVHLTNDKLMFESFHPSQLPHFLNGTQPTPINRTEWNRTTEEWTILYPPPPPADGIWKVTTFAELQHAVASMAAGDTVRVRAGVMPWSGSLVINVPDTTLSGGWDAQFEARDPGTTIATQASGRMIDVRADGCVIDGFSFRNNSVGSGQINFSLAELQDESVSGLYASPAQDGISNLVKYALGLPAKAPASGQALPIIALAGAQAPTLTYRERRGHPGEIAYKPEFSTDLVNWQNGGKSFELVSRIPAEGEGFDIVTIRPVLSPEKQGYFRVNIEWIGK